jgi:hypothetical protein
MIFEDLEAPTAGSEHPARLARGLRPQRLGEPAAGTRHRCSPPPAQRRHAKMAVGFSPPT